MIFLQGICRATEPLQNKKVDYGKHNGKDINNRFDELKSSVELRCWQVDKRLEQIIVSIERLFN